MVFEFIQMGGLEVFLDPPLKIINHYIKNIMVIVYNIILNSVCTSHTRGARNSTLGET